jgi:hypothetical protein
MLLLDAVRGGFKRDARQTCQSLMTEGGRMYKRVLCCIIPFGGLVIGAIFMIFVWNGSWGDSIGQQEENSNPRESALAMLSSLPEELRDIEDPEERLGLIVRIAEILERDNPERAKVLLITAFEEMLKRDAKQTEEPDRWNALRKRIITRIARHDEELAKRLLDRLDERSLSSEETSSAQEGYVHFARGLIDDHANLAGYMARKRMRSLLSGEGLLFLLDLREKDKTQADRLFLEVTSQVAAQGAKDVNELLLLYAYAFSPPLPLELTETAPRMRSLPGYRQSSADPDVAVPFLQSVIPPLLAPERYAGPGPVWGPRGDFFFITLILPQCHRFLPAFAEELERQRNALATLIPERQRSSLENSVSQSSSLPLRQESVERLLEKAERAPNQGGRDRFLFLALNQAIRRGDFERVSKIAEKFSPERREEILSFSNYLRAEKAIEEGNLAEALDYVRRPMRPSLKAYLLIVIAFRQFSSGEQHEAMSSLIEAEHIVRKLEPDRVKASLLLGVTAVHSLLETPHAFTTLQEVVETINKAKDFRGDISVGNLITVGDFSFAYRVDERVFSFELPFSLLGRRDFHVAMAFARAVARPALRARAVIAVCEGALKVKAVSSDKL